MPGPGASRRSLGGLVGVGPPGLIGREVELVRHLPKRLIGFDVLPDHLGADPPHGRLSETNFGVYADRGTGVRVRTPAHRDVAAPFNFLNKRFCGWEEEQQLAANNRDELVFRRDSGFILGLDKKPPTGPDVGMLVDERVGSPALTEDVDHPEDLR
jgi:hypothetical protein